MAKKDTRYLQKRNGVYHFRKRDNGMELKRSLNTGDYKTAIDLRNLYLANLIEYNQLDAPKEEDSEIITFGKVAKEWAAIHIKQVKYSTWRDYVSSMNGHILPRFKDVPILEISYSMIMTFRNGLKVGAKRANNIVVPLRSVFDFAHKEEIIKDNVMQKIKRLTEEEPDIVPFTLQEVTRILEFIHPWYRPYLKVAFFSGLRAGELNALKWSDFMENMKPAPHLNIKKTYVYKRDGVVKTKKSKRYIMCLPEVLDALEEQKKLTGDQNHIFLTVDGKRMTPDHFRKVIWTPALEKAGIEYRPPIQTRHTFATMMISAGEDVGWVQKMLGHASLQMIFQRYYSWIPKETRSDGMAFRKFVEIENKLPKKDADGVVAEMSQLESECTNIVPLANYR
jgi:integrase